MKFEFGQTKSESNCQKHGVDFVQAQALWLDEHRLEISAKTVDEPRSIVIGQINALLQSSVSAVIARR